jgi:hypothetical protein
MRSASFGAGAESLETKLVSTDEIPWSELAFPSTDFALRCYLEDRAGERKDCRFTEVARRL